MKHHKSTLSLKFFCFLLGITALSSALRAQQYNTLYGMKGIPQSLYSNPALQPHAGFYLGMPGASSIYTAFNNSGFAPQDVLKKRPDGTLYIDDQGMLNALNTKNFIQADFQHELLAFGFRSKKDYYSFNISTKTAGRFDYPKDFMLLMVNGNDYFQENDLPTNLNGLKINAQAYTELGMGYSRHWTESLTAGFRAKILLGHATMGLAKSNLQLITNPETYELQIKADLLLNKSFPFELQPLDSLENKEFNSDDMDWLDFATSTQNMGMAFDIGAHYKITERFSLGFSLLDWGHINWKRDVENFAATGTFDFKGFDFNDFFKEDSDAFDNLLDSIRDIFDIQETRSTFKTKIPAKVFLSGHYELSKRHSLGLLARAEFSDGPLRRSFTASYHAQPLRSFGYTLAWSVIENNYSNMGLGFHINIGPLQFYLVGDNLWPALRPHTMQTATVHLGLNWVAAYREKKDLTTPSFSW